MSTLLPNGRRNPSSGRDDLTYFPTLKKALSATSPSTQSRSRSANRSRNGSLGTPLVEVPKGDPLSFPASANNPPLFVDIPRMPRAAEAALTALKYLPTPLLVLSSLKTVLLANEAMGRLLGLENIHREDGITDGQDHGLVEEASGPDILRGQSMSQLGIDMIQDGQQIWVSWEVRFSTSAGGSCANPMVDIS